MTSDKSFRTSASNCARIYNDGLALHSLSSSLPAAYSKKFVLDVENIWDGLCLSWLLEDADEREEVLVLIHDAPTQAKRLQPAMQARNLRMAGPGQEAWNHVCELCCWIDTRSDGRKGEFEINLLSLTLVSNRFSFYSFHSNRWCYNRTTYLRYP